MFFEPSTGPAWEAADEGSDGGLDLESTEAIRLVDQNLKRSSAEDSAGYQHTLAVFTLTDCLKFQTRNSVFFGVFAESQAPSQCGVMPNAPKRAEATESHRLVFIVSSGQSNRTAHQSGNCFV